ncbi:hypothetical protein LTR50_002761 [Elasticomyces elasticus]|nr:hypothetical protein LTR50_002761 [Elasticomyces elasticus]
MSPRTLCTPQTGNPFTSNALISPQSDSTTEVLTDHCLKSPAPSAPRIEFAAQWPASPPLTPSTSTPTSLQLYNSITPADGSIDISLPAHSSQSEPQDQSQTPSRRPVSRARSGRNSWTTEQRTILCLLRRFTDNSWDDVTKVFNKNFQTELRVSPLRAQYYELCGQKTNEAWRAVFLESAAPDGVARWENELAELRLTARTVDVELVFNNGTTVAVTVTATVAAGRPRPKKRTLKQAKLGTKSNPKPKKVKSLTDVLSLEPPAIPERLLPTEEARKNSAPTKGLLYRFYDEKSQGTNSPTGFRAGAFANMKGTLPRPLSITEPYLTSPCAENHLNKNESPSPFISVTNSLVWIIRQMRQSPGQKTNPRFAVIDAAIVAEDDGIYHVPLFHKGLCFQKVFDKGAWRCYGTHDWLVWAHIPQRAILHTVDMKDLDGLVAADRSVHDLVRLQSLTSRDSFPLKIVPVMKAYPVYVLPRSIVAIAKLALLFGCTADSAPEHIAKMVEHIVNGWNLYADANTYRGWQQVGYDFAHQLLRLEAAPPTARPARSQQLHKVSQAFLEGLKNGLLPYNWELDNP